MLRVRGNELYNLRAASQSDTKEFTVPLVLDNYNTPHQQARQNVALQHILLALSPIFESLSDQYCTSPHQLCLPKRNFYRTSARVYKGSVSTKSTVKLTFVPQLGDGYNGVAVARLCG